MLSKLVFICGCVAVASESCASDLDGASSSAGLLQQAVQKHGHPEVPPVPKPILDNKVESPQNLEMTEIGDKNSWDVEFLMCCVRLNKWWETCAEMWQCSAGTGCHCTPAYLEGVKDCKDALNSRVDCPTPSGY
eukprot:Skav224492  [mRNA]  locus=scaffold1294:80970:81371:+ [translate_table: standard]